MESAPAYLNTYQQFDFGRLTSIKEVGLVYLRFLRNIRFRFMSDVCPSPPLVIYLAPYCIRDASK